MLDFIRIACAVPDVAVANVKHNAQEICKYIAQADEQNVDLLIFPELALTGATCADLFFEDALHHAVRRGMKQILECTKKNSEMIVVVGLPVRRGNQTINCAAVIQDGEICGLASKDNLSSDEKRWFTPVRELPSDGTPLWTVTGDTETEGDILLNAQFYNIGDISALGVTFGSDLDAPVSNASILAMRGAEIILSLGSEPEVVGSRAKRQRFAKAQSEALNCVYAYCSAGMMESTQDGVYCGHGMIAENGVILAENQDLTDSGYMIVMDCDLDKVRALRRRNDSYRNAEALNLGKGKVWSGYIDCIDFRSDGTLYHLNKLPFIPETKAERESYCREVFQIQVSVL